MNTRGYIESGYCFERSHGRWTIECSGDVEGEIIGMEEIDGSECAVLKVERPGGKKKLYAAMNHCVRRIPKEPTNDKD